MIIHWLPSLSISYICTVGGLEIEWLKSINISGPESDSDLILFSVALCVLHLNLLKIAAWSDD